MMSYPTLREIICVCGDVIEMPTGRVRREEFVIDLSTYRGEGRTRRLGPATGSGVLGSLRAAKAPPLPPRFHFGFGARCPLLGDESRSLLLRVRLKRWSR